MSPKGIQRKINIGNGTQKAKKFKRRCTISKKLMSLNQPTADNKTARQSSQVDHMHNNLNSNVVWNIAVL